MFVKILTDILSNQISFRVVNFFYCFFNSEQHYIDPEKNLVLKDYRPVFMVFLLSKKWNFTFSFIISFLCLKCPIISKQCSNISAHCKQKKTKHPKPLFIHHFRS